MKNNNSSEKKTFFKKIIKWKEWSDLDRVKDFALFFLSVFQKITTTTTATQTDLTFADLQARLNLSDSDIEQRKKGLIRLFRIMLIATCCFIGFAGYHLSLHHLIAASMSFSVSLICIGLGFRYHFWYLILKRRNLTLSWSEWFQEGIWGRQND